MPMDTLIKINEIQAKMAMNLESRRGALRDLGEQFPDQKLREIFEEVLEDTKEQGALDLIRCQIAAFNMMATGHDARRAAADGPGRRRATPFRPNHRSIRTWRREVQQLAYGIMPPEVMDFGSDDTAVAL